jgi:hypothetical protein
VSLPWAFLGMLGSRLERFFDAGNTLRRRELRPGPDSATTTEIHRPYPRDDRLADGAVETQTGSSSRDPHVGIAQHGLTLGPENPCENLGDPGSG